MASDNDLVRWIGYRIKDPQFFPSCKLESLGIDGSLIAHTRQCILIGHWGGWGRRKVRWEVVSESRSYYPAIFKGQPDSQMSQQFRINLVSYVTPLGKQVIGKFLLQDISLYPWARNKHLPSTLATTTIFSLLYSAMPKKVPTLWQRLHSTIKKSTHCMLSLDPKMLCLETFFWYATTC